MKFRDNLIEIILLIWPQTFLQFWDNQFIEKIISDHETDPRTGL